MNFTRPIDATMKVVIGSIVELLCWGLCLFVCGLDVGDVFDDGDDGGSAGEDWKYRNHSLLLC